MRELFAWSISSILIPLYLGTGYAAMTYHQFVLAYILAALGMVWAFGLMLVSSTHMELRSNVKALRVVAGKPNAKDKKVSKYKKARRKYHSYLMGVSTLILVFSYGFIYLLYASQEEYELSLLEGRLYPGEEPMPSHVCETIKDGEVVVFLGSNAMLVETFPHTVLEIKGQ